jgi:hypothetical protein
MGQNYCETLANASSGGYNQSMYVLTRLDLLRARLLKLSFKLPWTEDIFRSRALRLFAQFAGAFVVASAFALYVPVIPLIAAPLVAGPLHLLMSARAIGVRAWWPVALLCAALVYLTETPLAFTIFIAFAVIAFQAPRWQQRVLLIMAGAAFAYFAWISLYLAAALAGFVHNFVGFAFWFRVCRTRAEKTSCLIAYAALTTMTVAILFGAFDSVTPLFWTDRLPLDLADAFSFLGEPKRVLSAFALGQSIHYFVWLKAIPDQTLESPIPPAFRARWVSFERAVGRPLLVVLAVATCALVALAVLNLDEARRAYAAGAAIHGWLEVAALGLP